MKTKWIKYEKWQQRLRIKGGRTQNLNRRELETIREAKLPGVLKLKVEEAAPPVCLTVDIRGLITLSEYLKAVTLTKKLFAYLIEHIIHIVGQCESLKFSKDLLLYATDYVFIEERSLTVFMLYIPLQPFEAVGSLPELLQGIVREASFDDSEPTDYINSFLEIIGRNAPSAYVLSEYIRYLKQDHGIPGKIGNETLPEGVEHAALLERQTGRQYPVNKLPFRIGKQQDLSDLRIESHMVSRSHAEIILEQGSYYLADLGSTNGTYLNGRQLKASVKEQLHENDMLRFADRDYQFIFLEE